MLPELVPWSTKKQSHLQSQLWIGKVLYAESARPEHMSREGHPGDGRSSRTLMLHYCKKFSRNILHAEWHLGE